MELSTYRTHLESNISRKYSTQGELDHNLLVTEKFLQLNLFFFICVYNLFLLSNEVF